MKRAGPAGRVHVTLLMLLISTGTFWVLLFACQNSDPDDPRTIDRRLTPPQGPPCNGSWPEDPAVMLECCDLELPQGITADVAYGNQSTDGGDPCDTACAWYQHRGSDCSSGHNVKVNRDNCGENDVCASLAHELKHLEQAVDNHCSTQYSSCTGHAEVEAHVVGCDYDQANGQGITYRCRQVMNYCQDAMKEPSFCDRYYPDADAACRCGGGYDHLASGQKCAGLCRDSDQYCAITDEGGCECRDLKVGCPSRKRTCVTDRSADGEIPPGGIVCCSSSEVCCAGYKHNFNNDGPRCCPSHKPECCGVDENGDNLCCNKGSRCSFYRDENRKLVSRCCDKPNSTACGKLCCPDCSSCCREMNDGAGGCCDRKTYGAHPVCCPFGCCGEGKTCCSKAAESTDGGTPDGGRAAASGGECCDQYSEYCNDRTGSCCPNQLPNGCGFGCCEEGEFCCEKTGDPSTGACCEGDQICLEETGTCGCPEELPVQCSDTCCPEGKHCSDSGRDCQCPDDLPVECGSVCCQAGQVCSEDGRSCETPDAGSDAGDPDAGQDDAGIDNGDDGGSDPDIDGGIDNPDDAHTDPPADEEQGTGD